MARMVHVAQAKINAAANRKPAGRGDTGRVSSADSGLESTSDTTPASEYVASLEFEHHVKALQDLFGQLDDAAKRRQEDGVKRIVSTLHKYKQMRVSPADKLPAYCRVKKTSLIGGMGPRLRSGEATNTSNRRSSSITKTSSHTISSQSILHIGHKKSAKVSDSISKTGNSMPDEDDHGQDVDSAILRQHAAAHESLTSDLSELASRLKMRMEDVSTAVASRDAKIDRAHDGAADSLNSTKAASSRATSLYKAGWRNGCMQWILILVVAATFVGMFVMIRVTSMLGLKSQL